jgi:hypothetical protein
MNEIERITNSIALNYKLENELKNRTASLSVIENDADIIGPSEVLINNAFVLSDNILDFISAFDNLALINEISQTYHFETPIESNISGPFPISTISYTDNLSTNILSFANYLRSFEKLPYFTKIESLNITSGDKSGWMGSANISMKATLYTRTTQ